MPTGVYPRTEKQVNKEIKFTEIEYHEPTEQEIAEEEKYWAMRRFYCPHCKKVANFARCYNCGKRFCLEHAYEETDGTWETGYHTYPICYHCED